MNWAGNHTLVPQWAGDMTDIRWHAAAEQSYVPWCSLPRSKHACQDSNQWLKKLATQGHYYARLFVAICIHYNVAVQGWSTVSESRLGLVVCNRAQRATTLRSWVDATLVLLPACAAEYWRCWWACTSALLWEVYAWVPKVTVILSGGWLTHLKGNPGTRTRLPTSAHLKLQQHNKQKGADMSLYRASHWRGWNWKIPAWVCPRGHHMTCAHQQEDSLLCGYCCVQQWDHESTKIPKSIGCIKSACLQINTGLCLIGSYTKVCGDVGGVDWKSDLIKRMKDVLQDGIVTRNKVGIPVWVRVRKRS